ncbi:alpha/beta hydrolase [Pyxidicoccus parkwayensis]|uniref:Alpha/beta hydrolase n=1 Tax=Pyxidicoccus parkwayensis TaxID=2813578 RepID=A0ABX7P5H6_9BACT|nr:alpha/beta hydrolase [Pyxidicoccus parkwaysis]QSQ25681.1 alpha/beta hydrolase [Pyxidicoccus parkwaysis]
MSQEPRKTEPVISTHQQSDGYRSHYRRWGRSEGSDVLVYLHGGISHAGWQAPLGEAITASSEVTFIALDRRGSGLNSEARGHLISEEREVEDIASFLEAIGGSFRRVHLGGWCFGAQVASIVAARLASRGVLTSLVLVAPGYVYTERYSDVLRLSMQAVSEVVKELGVTPEPLRAFVPVPLQTSDFTDKPQWLKFVEEDTLRLSRVTQSTVKVWGELGDRSRSTLGELGGLPVLAVFGSRDRLVDLERTKAMLLERVHPAPTIELMSTHHALHFEDPRALADLILRFISSQEPRLTAVAASRPGVATATAQQRGA